MPTQPPRPDAGALLRWQRERRLLEQFDREGRRARRRRLILVLVIGFLLLDLIISISIILATTSSADSHDRVGKTSSSYLGLPMGQE